MVPRRQFGGLASAATAASALPGPAVLSVHRITASTSLPTHWKSRLAAPSRRSHTNTHVPGPLLRFKECEPVTIQVTTKPQTTRSCTGTSSSFHRRSTVPWRRAHPTSPQATSPVTPSRPAPAGFRWYHAHTFAGSDLKKPQYTSRHGFLAPGL